MKKYNVSFEVSRSITFDPNIIKNAIRWPKNIDNDVDKQISMSYIAQALTQYELEKRTNGGDWKIKEGSCVAE
jgi:hypothetical protein